MKPHVVIIMADQLRYDVLGKGFTPNIDSIAKQGVNFENAYCASPLCVPARGAFFTGTYPNNNGSIINPWEPADAKHGNVKREIGNLYNIMENDWCSVHSGKQHLFTEGGKLEKQASTKTRWESTEESYKAYLKENKKPMPGGEGFRTIIPEMVGGKVSRVKTYSTAATGCYEAGQEFYFDEYFTVNAIEGLRNRDKTKPLLLNAMFLAPHPPLHIPEPWHSKVQQKDFELPENVGNWYKRQSPLQMYNLTGIVGTRYNREHWKEAWRVYLGLVSMLDNCVGRVLNELKEQGIYDDSLIVFTSDHGEMLGSHALFQKMCMYEESARVPLYIKLPKGDIPAVTNVGKAVSHIDVMPTLCDYLNLQTPHTMDGTSLMPLINGEKPDENAPVFIQFDGNGSRSNFQRCVVANGYKLIVDMFKDETYYELYNLKKDPQEKNNLMFEQSGDEISAKLMAMLSKHMQNTNDMLSLTKITPQMFREQYYLFPGL